MSLVLTEDRGAVRHIVINRPEKRNALNGDTIRELGAAIEQAAGDDAFAWSWCAARARCSRPGWT